MADDELTPPTDDAPDDQPDKEWQAEATKWKALARKHEKAAKDNADAAKRLAEIEESGKTEQERLAEALAPGEERLHLAVQPMLVGPTRASLPKRAEEGVYVLDGERLDLGGEFEACAHFLQAGERLAVPADGAACLAFDVAGGEVGLGEFIEQRHGRLRSPTSLTLGGLGSKSMAASGSLGR